MKLTVAINSYKNPEMLRLCLEKVRSEVKGTDAEILVADSVTEEATEMMMREEFSDVRFFPDRRNIGFVAMVNRCLSNAHGEYILLLNSDILLGEGAIEKAITYLKSHSDIGILGIKLLNFDGTLQYSCFRFYRLLTIAYRRTFLKIFSFAKRHLDYFVMKEYDHAAPKDVDWIMGSALLVRRSAIEKVGGMDPRFFMYMEDVDWCRRFWEKGFRVVYFPYAYAYHYHGKGSARGGALRSLLFNRLTWVHIESALKYFWKYRGKPLPH